VIPRILIVVELEAAPRVRVIADNEHDKQQLLAWLRTDRELAALVGHGVRLDPCYVDLRDAA
jgi:hypothetical protein